MKFQMVNTADHDALIFDFNKLMEMGAQTKALKADPDGDPEQCCECIIYFHLG